MALLSLIYNNDEKLALEAITREDLNIVDRMGDTPLHFAVATGNLNIVHALLYRNVNINARNNNGKTALHLAVDKHSLPIIKLLIDNNIDINIEDSWGNQALWTAVFNAAAGDLDKLPIVELLLKHGADKNHKNEAGRSPSDFANQVGFQDLIEVVNRY